ncbi:hypothetical protein [Niveibacterium sp. SC-1]|uniref:Dyp-type peroxidase n=1 Tax=Niveibacterium sp. SC-1 TaxID=3135646 RepID=UPI00311F8E66
MSGAAVDYEDIQGLVRFGYKHLTQASFLLLRITQREAAQAWLAAAPVLDAQERKPLPQTALQVALTREGLEALGVPPEVLTGFSAEFLAGMASDAARSRRLGDIGQNAPSGWQWGAPTRMPHVLVMLYAVPGELPAFEQSIRAGCEAGFELVDRLATSDMDGTEPFGFIDGISQPEPDWERQRPVEDATRFDYTNVACLGEFLLGYPNEYGAYTDRPLLDRAADAVGILPRAEDASDCADLGRNGSYLVMRQLRQEVEVFWQYLDHQAHGDAALRQQWAEAMVGRRLDGRSLVAEGPVAPDKLNDFDYRGDPRGLRCPLGAHVRRANPRNADLPGDEPGPFTQLLRTLGFDPVLLAQDRVASTRFHRLLRRGREYGVARTIAQAVAGTPAPDAETGLHFICLGANIARQFEFVQNAWIAGTHFDGLRSEGDPLLGHRQPGPDGSATDCFSLPDASGPDQRLCGLPAFVRVIGGAYFFLPGIRALRFLATVR